MTFPVWSYDTLLAPLEVLVQVLMLTSLGGKKGRRGEGGKRMKGKGKTEMMGLR